MISRLTAFAATFAVLAAATMTFAAGMPVAPASQAKQVLIEQLETVVVVAHRDPNAR